MIICLKGISEECFSFSGNVNASLKFLWALRGLSQGTQILGYSKGIWALVQSEGPRALRRSRHSGTGLLWVLRQLGTWALKMFGHSGTWALEALYLADSKYIEKRLMIENFRWRPSNLPGYCLFKHVAKKNLIDFITVQTINHFKYFLTKHGSLIWGAYVTGISINPFLAMVSLSGGFFSGMHWSEGEGLNKIVKRFIIWDNFEITISLALSIISLNSFV